MRVIDRTVTYEPTQWMSQKYLNSFAAEDARMVSIFLGGSSCERAFDCGLCCYCIILSYSCMLCFVSLPLIRYLLQLYTCTALRRFFALASVHCTRTYIHTHSCTNMYKYVHSWTHIHTYALLNKHVRARALFHQFRSLFTYVVSQILGWFFGSFAHYTVSFWIVLIECV